MPTDVADNAFENLAASDNETSEVEIDGDENNFKADAVDESEVDTDENLTNGDDVMQCEADDEEAENELETVAEAESNDDTLDSEVEADKLETIDEVVSDEIETVTEADEPCGGDNLSNVNDGESPEISSESLFFLKSCFNNIESVVKKMYGDVFSKIPNFKPTYAEAINDFILFIADKALKVNRYDVIKKAFNLDDDVYGKISAKAVPDVIKLTCAIDKKANTSCTAIVLRELTKTLLELLKNQDDATRRVTEELSDVYAYVTSYGINLS